MRIVLSLNNFKIEDQKIGNSAAVGKRDLLENASKRKWKELALSDEWKGE